MTPIGLFSREMFNITAQVGTEQGAGVEYAKNLNVDFSKEDLYHIKEAAYCGDNDSCTENCAVGYFYMDSDYTIKDAMKELGLGEPDGLQFLQPKYSTVGTECIVVGSEKFAEGEIVEYKITGVC